ncbi:hypothetical protein FQN57_002106 [Myotisia sp. PD_48]|nr:hypothetical protein FQN57_002106 [Myotisia sp. PD_48]
MSLIHLPPEILSEILSLVPMLDYYSLRLAGSRYLTSVVQNIACSIPRGIYSEAVHAEDARRRDRSKRHRREEICSVESNILEAGQDNARATLQLKKSFRSALHWAACYGSKTVLDGLLDYIHLRSHKHKWTALHCAVIECKIEIIHVLLSNGANINALDDLGRTPLGLIVDKDDCSEAADILQRKGAKKHVYDVMESAKDLWVQKLMDPESNIDLIQQLINTHLPDKLVKRSPVFKRYYEYRKLKQDGYTTGLDNRGFVSFVSLAIAEGLDVNSRPQKLIADWNGSWLHLAATADKDSMIESLLRSGADPTVTSKFTVGLKTFDVTPFELAACVGKTESIGSFIRSGISVHTLNSQGESAVHIAAGPRTLQFLLEKGADLEATSLTGQTPLHKSVSRLEYFKVKYLVEAGCNVNARDKGGRTPLMTACSAGVETIAHHINAQGHNVHDKFFGSSIWRRLMYVIECLIEHGADIRARDADGRSAVDHAIHDWSAGRHSMGDWYPSERVTKYLIKRGVDVNARAGDGNSLLHLAVLWENRGPIGLRRVNTFLPSRFLLDHGANPNTLNSQSLAPLHLTYNLAEWEDLLYWGANVDVLDPQDRTTLLRLLSNTEENFSLAVLTQQCKVLLRNGANPNTKDRNGYTALMHVVACRTNEPGIEGVRINDIIKVLLQYGADETIKTPDGLSLFDLADEDFRQTFMESASSLPAGHGGNH